MVKYRKNASPTTGGFGGLPAVTPKEIDRVRRSVLDVVRRNIPKVRLVLAGEKRWSNQQVRLFALMLNKVMPDLHHSFNQHSIENKDPNELTLEELEAIAAQAIRPYPYEKEDEDYEDADYEELPQNPDDPDDDNAPGSSEETDPDPQGPRGL